MSARFRLPLVVDEPVGEPRVATALVGTELPRDTDDTDEQQQSWAPSSAMQRIARVVESDVRVALGAYSKRRAFGGPRIMQIRVPAVCDHHCVFCVSLVEDAPQQDEVKFDFGRYLRLMDEAIALGTLRFSICSQGETLLFPKLKPLIRHIRRRSRGAATVKLVTHGTAIPQVGVDFFVRHRVHFWLSLHGGDFETWQCVHRPDTPDPEAMFRELKRSISALTASRRCPVTLHNVISKQNYDKVDAIVDFAVETGVKALSFSIVRGFEKHQLDGSERASLRARLGQLARAMQARGIEHNLASFAHELDSPSKTNARHWTEAGTGFYNQKRCYVGWLMTFIDADGGIQPCCRGKHLGNIYEDSFADVWSGQYADFRRRSVNIPEAGPVPGYDCEHCSHVTLNDTANRLVVF
jgi:MoaA/NifB/PqqE/SkfB family radical SAM enzyme